MVTNSDNFYQDTDQNAPGNQEEQNANHAPEENTEQPEDAQDSGVENTENLESDSTVELLEAKDTGTEVTETPESITPDKEETPTAEVVTSNQPEGESAVYSIEENIARESEHAHTEIPDQDFSAMGWEEMIAKFQEFLTHENIKSVQRNIDRLIKTFKQKLSEDKKEKEQKFLEEEEETRGYFQYRNPYFPKFKELQEEFRKRKKQYYDELKRTHEANLLRKRAIIEELKKLIDEGDPETIFDKFKEIQKAWREVGPVSREYYQDLWRTYHFHVDRFYDLQHLRKDLRNLDFKHNLEEKLKLAQRAEALAENEDIVKSFKELQILHRLWKEIGPVAREHKEEVWNRFSEATKIIHRKRQEYQAVLNEKYKENLMVKHEIIEQINALKDREYHHQSEWRKSFQEMEKLRERFFNTGPVPAKESSKIWKAFRESVRQYNRKKNEFFKELKKFYKDNINKKKELIKIAKEHQDSNDFENSTQVMKQIQKEWKKTGPVPRKISDKLWAEFQKACNHYFDRLHQAEDEKNAEKNAIFLKKKTYLEDLKSEIAKDPDFAPDMDTIKTFITEWKNFGMVQPKQRYIDARFYKLLDTFFSKISSDRKETEMLKYKAKIDDFISNNDHERIDDEIYFVRNRIDTLERERQNLENNLGIISSKEANNPLILNIKKKIKQLEDDVSIWKDKLKYLRSIDI